MNAPKVNGAAHGGTRAPHCASSGAQHVRSRSGQPPWERIRRGSIQPDRRVLPENSRIREDSRTHLRIAVLGGSQGPALVLTGGTVECRVGGHAQGGVTVCNDRSMWPPSWRDFQAAVLLSRCTVTHSLASKFRCLSMWREPASACAVCFAGTTAHGTIPQLWQCMLNRSGSAEPTTTPSNSNNLLFTPTPPA